MRTGRKREGRQTDGQWGGHQARDSGALSEPGGKAGRGAE